MLSDKTSARFAPARSSGGPIYVLFVRGKTLMAQRFDGKPPYVVGDAAPAAQNVGSFYGGWLSDFSVSDNGVLVWSSALPVPQELVWMDRHAQPLEKLGRLVYSLIVALSSYAVFEFVGAVYYLLAGVLAGNVWEALRRCKAVSNRDNQTA